MTDRRLGFFLTARHWQIFLIFVGGTMLAQLIALRELQDLASPRDIQRLMAPFLVLTIVFAAVFLG